MNHNIDDNHTTYISQYLFVLLFDRRSHSCCLLFLHCILSNFFLRFLSWLFPILFSIQTSIHKNNTCQCSHFSQDLGASIVQNCNPCSILSCLIAIVNTFQEKPKKDALKEQELLDWQQSVLLLLQCYKVDYSQHQYLNQKVLHR